VGEIEWSDTTDFANILDLSIFCVCCSMLQCVAVCCRVLQCVAVLIQTFLLCPSSVCIAASGCSALQRVESDDNVYDNVLQCVAMCCSVLQCVAVCCSVLGVMIIYMIMCCSVLQCVAVCCNVLQCVAAC